MNGELTAREREVAALAALGRKNREIAEALGLSEKTVEWHLSRVLRKLGRRSRVELAARVEALGGPGSPLGPPDTEDGPFGLLPAFLGSDIDTGRTRSQQ